MRIFIFTLLYTFVIFLNSVQPSPMNPRDRENPPPAAQLLYGENNRVTAVLLANGVIEPIEKFIIPAPSRLQQTQPQQPPPPEPQPPQSSPPQTRPPEPQSPQPASIYWRLQSLSLDHEQHPYGLPTPQNLEHEQPNHGLPVLQNVQHQQPHYRLNLPQYLQHQQANYGQFTLPKLQHEHSNHGLNPPQNVENQQYNDGVFTPQNLQHEQHNHGLTGLQNLQHQQHYRLNPPQNLQHQQSHVLQPQSQTLQQSHHRLTPPQNLQHQISLPPQPPGPVVISDGNTLWRNAIDKAIYHEGVFYEKIPFQREGIQKIVVPQDGDYVKNDRGEGVGYFSIRTRGWVHPFSWPNEHGTT